MKKLIDRQHETHGDDAGADDADLPLAQVAPEQHRRR